MPKTILAIAAALLAVMTVFASAAQAGSKSRGYGGPLGVGPSFGATESYGAKDYSPKHYKKKRVRSAPKKHKARPAKEVDTAKTTPIEKEAENENSDISGASLETEEAAEETTVKTEAKPKDEPKTTKNVGCKKFFPTIGQTLTVPCE